MEIDYCGRCRGLFLDAGELDLVVHRTIAAAQQLGKVHIRAGKPLGQVSGIDWERHLDYRNMTVLGVVLEGATRAFFEAALG